MPSDPWDCYDLAREVRLNLHFHQRMLALVVWVDRLLQAMMAVATVGAVVQALPWLGLLAAVVAVLRPILGVSGALTAHAAAVAGYRSLDSRLVPLVQDLRRGEVIDAAWVALRHEREQIEVHEPALVIPLITFWLRKSSQKDAQRELPESLLLT
jgi:hypothetical protein